MNKPVLQLIDGGLYVVRDDRLQGGTKSRFMHLLFKNTDEVCYASSSCGAGQVALAITAAKLGKKCTIVAAERHDRHPRQLEAMKHGANFYWCKAGYQNVLNSHMKKYCQKTGATPAPFGLRVEGAVDIIAEAAASISKVSPTFVWVSGGSGLLASSLRQAWQNSEHHVCQVGHKLTADEVGSPDTIIHEAPKPYGYAMHPNTVPFDSDLHYEAKTYQLMQAWLQAKKRKGTVLYWHACGSAKV